MAPRSVRLGPQAQKIISAAVDLLFDRAKARLLGPNAKGIDGKQLIFRFNPEFSLTGLFLDAGKQEGATPREEVLNALLKISGSYVDAHREKTKAKVLQHVQTFLADAQAQGIKTDVQTVLGGQLADIWAEVKTDIRRVAETETTITRNASIFDSIGRIAATTGREDPNVFFVTVRDQHRCKECTRLHMMPDETTPRVWKMSQLGSGYHKRGESNPKVGGLHPHCRCVLTHLLPGYGFDAAGRITYISQGYDEYAKQHGEEQPKT